MYCIDHSWSTYLPRHLSPLTFEIICGICHFSKTAKFQDICKFYGRRISLCGADLRALTGPEKADWLEAGYLLYDLPGMPEFRKDFMVASTRIPRTIVGFTMRMFRPLNLHLPYPSCFWKRGISSSQPLANRNYLKSQSWRWPNPCSSRRQASSAPASGAARRLLSHSGIGPILEAYSKIQGQRPYTTQICTSIGIWLCGDLSAQFLFPPEPADDEDNEALISVKRHGDMTLGGQYGI